jgi:hypothetical protein
MEKTLKRLADEIAYLGGCSLNDAERRYYGGTLSERCYMIYCLFWTWGSYKVADLHRWPQDKLLARRGPAALVRRINQFRAALGKERDLRTAPHRECPNSTWTGRERSRPSLFLGCATIAAIRGEEFPCARSSRCRRKPSPYSVC